VVLIVIWVRIWACHRGIGGWVSLGGACCCGTGGFGVLDAAYHRGTGDSAILDGACRGTGGFGVLDAAYHRGTGDSAILDAACRYGTGDFAFWVRIRDQIWAFHHGNVVCAMLDRIPSWYRTYLRRNGGFWILDETGN